MISTGIIRRIDELGRIVIPKEIRRSLNIRDGENIEIIVENNQIILRKYNLMNTNNNLAKKLCEIIYNEFNCKIIITDREKIIAEKGINNELVNTKLNSNLINAIENRKIETKYDLNLTIENKSIIGNFIFIPIISLNDSIGLVIMYNKEKFSFEESLGKLVAAIFSQKLDI